MMIAFLIMLALAPVAAIIAYIYKQDKFEREPTRLLLSAFGLGLLSVVPAFTGSYYGNVAASFFNIPTNFLQITVQAFIVVAFAEELAKFIFLRGVIYPNKNFNEPLDGIVYSVIISMGFAAFENILYVIEGGIKVGLLRMLTAVPAHASFGVFMGYYVGLAKFDEKNRKSLLIKGLFYPVLAHGLYDFFLMHENVELMALISFMILAISLRISYTAIKNNQAGSPFKNVAFAPRDIQQQAPTPPIISNSTNDNEYKNNLQNNEQIINNQQVEINTPPLPMNQTWQHLFGENLPTQKLPNKDENL